VSRALILSHGRLQCDRDDQEFAAAYQARASSLLPGSVMAPSSPIGGSWESPQWAVEDPVIMGVVPGHAPDGTAGQILLATSSNRLQTLPSPHIVGTTFGHSFLVVNPKWQPVTWQSTSARPLGGAMSSNALSTRI